MSQNQRDRVLISELKLMSGFGAEYLTFHVHFKVLLNMEFVCSIGGFNLFVLVSGSQPVKPQILQGECEKSHIGTQYSDCVIFV